MKESAQLGFIHEIDAHLKGMLALVDGEVVTELEFRLVRLLGNVWIRPQLRIREADIRDLVVGINQVIPVLISEGKRVDYGGSDHRI